MFMSLGLKEDLNHVLLIFKTGHKVSAQQGFVNYVGYPSGQTR